jgi:hypothetical protein
MTSNGAAADAGDLHSHELSPMVEDPCGEVACKFALPHAPPPSLSNVDRTLSSITNNPIRKPQGSEFAEILDS